MDTPRPEQVRTAQPAALEATDDENLELMEMILGALGRDALGLGSSIEHPKDSAEWKAMTVGGRTLWGCGSVCWEPCAADVVICEAHGWGHMTRAPHSPATMVCPAALLYRRCKRSTHSLLPSGASCATTT